MNLGPSHSSFPSHSLPGTAFYAGSHVQSSSPRFISHWAICCAHLLSLSQSPPFLAVTFSLSAKQINAYMLLAHRSSLPYPPPGRDECLCLANRLPIFCSIHSCKPACLPACLRSHVADASTLRVTDTHCMCRRRARQTALRGTDCCSRRPPGPQHRQGSSLMQMPALGFLDLQRAQADSLLVDVPGCTADRLHSASTQQASSI